MPGFDELILPVFYDGRSKSHFQFLQRLLDRSDYSLYTWGAGESAPGKIEGGGWVAVLSEVPEDQAEALSSPWNMVPVLWVAETAGPELKEKAWRAGVFDCLSLKTLTTKQLTEALQRAIYLMAKRREVGRRAEQYQSMFEMSVVGMYRTSLDGDLTLANEALATICGFETVEKFLAASRQFNPRDFYRDPERRDLFLRQLKKKGRLSGFVSQIRRTDGQLRWISENAWVVRDGNGEIIYFEGTVQDITQQRRIEEEHGRLLQAEAGQKAAEEASARAALLARASQVLSSALDVSKALDTLADLATEWLADWCVVDLVDNGEIRRAALRQADPALGQEAAWLGSVPPVSLADPSNILARVVRQGRSHVRRVITDHFLRQTARNEEHFQILKRGGMRSHIIVPLKARGHVMGAMTLVSTQKGRRYGPDDVQLAEDLAGRAALAIDNARLYEQAQAEVQERRRAQEILRFSERRFRTMIESSADVIFLVSVEGLVFYASPAIEVVFGYKPEDLYGMADPFLLVADNDRARVVELFAEVMSKPGGDQVMSACQIRDAAGHYRSVEFSATNLADDPAIGAALVNIRDVTERQELEWQKDAFLGIASHELKTPITSMKAFNQILERHLQQKDDQTGLGYVMKNQKQLGKLTRLVNSLLDVTRLQSGGLSLTMGPVDLDTLIQEVVEEVAEIDNRHTVLIRGRLDRLVVADRDRLSQVLVNLLTNAVKYSPQSQTVEVAIGQEAGWARVAVRDFGIGIAEKDRKRIFDRFYRAEEVLTSVAGLGLGLYIASEIARQHGGKIEVESRPGEGSTFWLIVPLHQSSVD